VVLVEPEIPWNTGNVGRTCLATDARLHLVRPLGFRLDERNLRRAGLDYWQHVDPKVWPSWSAFEDALGEPGLDSAFFFSAEAERDFWQVDFPAADEPVLLILGSESAGLPKAVREAHRERLVRIPMMGPPEHVRSLNLSTAAALAIYEIRRRQATSRDRT
jgi:tRNA (cytidine/uridine-2'-O-)-methyltransferase